MSVIAPDAIRPVGTEDRGFCLGCWRNGLKRPVLKHGPRSLTSVRVFGWKTRARNESERRWDPQGAPSTDPDFFEGFE